MRRDVSNIRVLSYRPQAAALRRGLKRKTLAVVAAEIIFACVAGAGATLARGPISSHMSRASAIRVKDTFILRGAPEQRNVVVEAAGEAPPGARHLQITRVTVTAYRETGSNLHVDTAEVILSGEAAVAKAGTARIVARPALVEWLRATGVGDDIAQEDTAFLAVAGAVDQLSAGVVPQQVPAGPFVGTSTSVDSWPLETPWFRPGYWAAALAIYVAGGLLLGGCVWKWGNRPRSQPKPL